MKVLLHVVYISFNQVMRFTQQEIPFPVAHAVMDQYVEKNAYLDCTQVTRILFAVIHVKSAGNTDLTGWTLRIGWWKRTTC